jgi:hypothetical protein
MTAATLHVDCSQPYLIVAQEQKNAKPKSGMRAPGLALFRDLERNISPESEICPLRKAAPRVRCL